MAVSFVFINSLSIRSLKKKDQDKIDSGASTGGHAKDMFSFPWPLAVAAHDHKRLAQTLYKVKVKVKSFLEQATKAQRGSIGMAILFL